MVEHRKRYVLALGVLTALFALRVTGQAVQFVAPQAYLPRFDSFQGSRLAYPVLLLSQVVILAIMLRICLRTASRTSVPNPRLGRVLAWLGGLYMLGSAARIAIGLAMPSAPAWFSTWIPAVFHVVLAGFVLTVASYHLRPPQR